MVRILVCLASVMPFVSLASEMPDVFKIQCEQVGHPIVFAYDKSKYPDTFLIGVRERAKSLDVMAAYDLESIERGELVGSEFLAVYYTTNEFNHYGEDKKVLHKLTYFESNSIITETATLNKDATKLVSILQGGSHSSIAPISNCVSLGIW